MEYYSAIKKKEMMLHMDETRELYPKWNKPITEAQMLHDSIYMNYDRQSNSYAENRRRIARS